MNITGTTITGKYDNLQEVKDFKRPSRKLKNLEAAGIEPASADPLPSDLHV